MAHFAKIEDGGIVSQVIVINNDCCLDADGNESEEVGINFCIRHFGGTWKQTSYNTVGNKHYDSGTPFRKNFASVGYTYDAERDAFIEPKPFDSWTLNESTCCYLPPLEYPSDASDTKQYYWSEENYKKDSSTAWVEFEKDV